MRDSASVSRQQQRSPKRKKSSVSSVFRGDLFCTIRLIASEGAVDFGTEDVKRQITQHGGKLLSTKLVEALRGDRQAGLKKKRTCYVVFWGGYSTTHITIHPLLSQLIKNDGLCEVVPVTPIWIMCAVSEKALPNPKRRPLLFQPQVWPFRKLPSELKVAVTGFVKTERAGIIHLLRATGVRFTEDMAMTNTHLICKDRRGQKFDKAREWGLHVVSLHWLYHVVQHGYKKGCEGRFCMRQMA